MSLLTPFSSASKVIYPFVLKELKRPQPLVRAREVFRGEPTDAKLLHAAIKGLNRLARKHAVRLRQSYLRIAKTAAMMAGRYAHAKQFKRHQRQLRILRSRLGRIRTSHREHGGCW